MKYIACDIDGVLTDGCVCLDSEGRETKKIFYRDLDALAILRSLGYGFTLVTGEDSKMARIIAEKFGADDSVFGAKDKLSALKKLSEIIGTELADIIYIGDSDRDAPALLAAGLGIAPRDASAKALASADIITTAHGGGGVLQEVAELIVSGEIT